MAANGNRYLKVDSATSLPIEQASNDGGVSGTAGDIVALDGTAKIPSAFLPAGLGVDTVTVTAFEALTAGDFVNLFLDSGTLKARLADASTSAGAKRADGFVLSNVLITGSALVYMTGQNTQRSGLTIGARYFLSDATPGGVLIAASAPTTAAHLLQYLGIALSATVIDADIDDKPIIRG